MSISRKLVMLLPREALREKCLNTEDFFGPYFPVYLLKMKRYTGQAYCYFQITKKWQSFHIRCKILHSPLESSVTFENFLTIELYLKI